MSFSSLITPPTETLFHFFLLQSDPLWNARNIPTATLRYFIFIWNTSQPSTSVTWRKAVIFWVVLYISLFVVVFTESHIAQDNLVLLLLLPIICLHKCAPLPTVHTLLKVKPRVLWKGQLSSTNLASTFPVGRQVIFTDLFCYESSHGCICQSYQNLES